MTPQRFSLFFYGTLMAPAVLYRVIYGLKGAPESSNLIIRAAILQDHERHRVLGVDYPGVVPRPDKTVRGTLVENLTLADVQKLDAFEGDEYERRNVIVKLVDEEANYSAQTYIWIDSEDRLAKEEWNFEEFVKEKIGRWTGQSAEFRDVDALATGGRSAWDGEVVRNAV